MMAYHSEGFSVGAIKRVVETILNGPRMIRLEVMPLKPQEFIE